MKTLMLLRHAKSDWDDSSLADFDRPLAARGKRDAPRVGKSLRKRGVFPDLIISSPAVRAKTTIDAVTKSAKLGNEVQFDASIYGASSGELMRIIRRWRDDISCSLLVGHNPGFEELLYRLTGSRDRMPTAALACIEFEIDSWEDIEEGKGRLAWLVTPKQLASPND